MFPDMLFIIWDTQTKEFVKMPDGNLTRSMETVESMNEVEPNRYVVVNYSLGESGL